MTPFEIELMNLCNGKPIAFAEQFIEMIPAIAVLAAEYAGQRWIPMSKRHPENHQICIAFRPNATKKPAEDPKVALRQFINGKWSGLHKVTHWMPLPESPIPVT